MHILIDSGVEISLIKSGNVKRTELVNQNDKCNITGINSEIVETFGTILSTNNLCSQHIPLNDSVPVYIPNYRTVHSRHEEIRQKLIQFSNFSNE